MINEKLTIKKKLYRGDTEVVSARLPADLIAELNTLAKETGRSRNEIVEKCLIFALERIKLEEE